jgi:hypothetical protein
MKIFSENKPAIKATPVVSKKPTGKIIAAPTKAPISDAEIREKVAANTEISSAAKARAKEARDSQKLGEGFMKAPEDHVLKSDVQLNNPEDPVTTEKLKSVLSNGGFNFNPKEREVLSKILEE